MIKAIQTRYDGYHFRSRAEARWAVFFSTVGLRYEYEKEGYHLPSGNYLPDFFLPDLGFWFEVKGVSPTDEEKQLAWELCKETGHSLLLAIGAPKPEDQILYFPDFYEGTLFSSTYHFEDDRRNKGELWLVASDADYFSVGPHFGPDHGKCPCIHSATKKGYDASRAARFEFNR